MVAIPDIVKGTVSVISSELHTKIAMSDLHYSIETFSGSTMLKITS